jgi:hypothetical protein
MRGNKSGWKAEDRLLVALLRRESLAGILASCSLDEVKRTAARHLMTAPLAQAILDEGAGAGTGGFLHWAAGALLSAERDKGLYDSCLRRAGSILAAKGLPAIVLKGRSLAFGRPRDVGDLDLLLPEGRLLEAIAALEAEGYSYVGGLRNMRIRQGEDGNWPALMRWSNQFEFLDSRTRGLVELHSGFFEKSRVYAEDLSALEGAMGDILASCVADPESGCLFLSKEDRLLLLALHASLKRSPDRRDFILRHVDDFRRLLEAGIDWEALAARARACRALPQLHFLMRVSALLIDLGPDADAAAAEIGASLRGSEKVLVGLQLRCLKDLRRKSYGAAFLYRLIAPFVLPSSASAKLKSALILPLLFPAPWRLAEIYGLPPRSKAKYLFYLLEPFRWCIVLLKNCRR